MTADTYAADRTALLIVDPYNDFMSEGGKLYNAIRETADASGMFDNLRGVDGILLAEALAGSARQEQLLGAM